MPAKRITKKQRQAKLMRVDGLVLDVRAHEVQGKSGAWKLTPKECQLLAEFMRHPEEVLTRKHLMKEIWETDYLGDTRTLNVHVRWLRQKIEEDPSSPRYLRTVRGVGYRFGIPDRSLIAGQQSVASG